MKRIKIILSILVLAVIVTSCNKPSLQKYLVDSQEKTGFITLDLPSSLLQLKSDDVSDDVKETLKSIKKINLVGLPYKGNEEAYEKEKTELKTILEGTDYKSLMRMNHKGMQMKLYYTGSGDAIDEVIAFGYNEKMGVGVARILGDNMNPAQIVKMMQNVKFDTDGVNLKGFNAAFEASK